MPGEEEVIDHLLIAATLLFFVQGELVFLYRFNDLLLAARFYKALLLLSPGPFQAGDRLRHALVGLGESSTPNHVHLEGTAIETLLEFSGELLLELKLPFAQHFAFAACGGELLGDGFQFGLFLPRHRGSQSQ